ncbi:Fic [Rickettsia akari str. Hartford]|uniref:Fic n=1 Tax=Rickettsia akari (strain Hartford) TaxID=293614 RepID=A8GNW4_RICAH|nr:MerR family transcriptional regulator [Rickettsia akari]ABV75089.1 Fic [Rickettsia akari str. Hartford]
MNLILIMEGYPPAIIKPQERLPYITSLETEQFGGSKEKYEKIIYHAVNRSLDIYFKAIIAKEPSDIRKSERLMKIGKLAKFANENVSTIRFWTKIGLLEIADITDSKAALERCKKNSCIEKTESNYKRD